MKSIYLLLSGLWLLTACARPTVPRANVQYMGTQDGVVTVSVVGDAAGQRASQENAERSVLETLLFRGLPGSPQNLPLISEDQQAASRTQSGYLQALFETKRYRQFITQSVADGRVITDRGNRNGRPKTDKIQAWLVGVNLPALRRDMEANQVIRKFGY